MPPHSPSLSRSQVLVFTTLLILPLLLLAILPWQPFLTGSLQSGWLWWPYALTRMVDIPGIGISAALLLLLTRQKLHLDRSSLLALAGALLVLLAGDWLIKSIIKHLTEEPRPYLLWLESQSLIPAIKSFYAASTDVRSEQVHAASQLLALPQWLGNHWQKEVNYAFPSGHSIAAMSLAQFFGLIWLARAPACVWLLPLWALGIGLSRMVIGMHWPTDVLASAILGSITALLAARWWLHRY
ncbi:phosphatase PAP2 family protein [Aeromonas jandaei]|uniref:phosphatase PAP2 family protein n=1 Tax=Aeromonas jandaei TaxID=650 RepID=UPI0019331C32|nr:phosphatase PAP2 family protein [Aeromonas jandaei]MBM0492166.1 phosphatase PAP2 family protein [Aeromonas jandaei]MBM0569465.1 phosphatase PAP2 family protein [Aeromonas jandaei]